MIDHPWRLSPGYTILGLMAVLLTACFWPAGCAPKVQVEKAAPAIVASHPVPDKTMALGELTGAHGADLARSLRRALARNRDTVLVDKNGADMILAGKVEGTVTDTKGTDLVKAARKTGGKEEVVVADPFLKKEYKVKKPVVEYAAESVPHVVRRAEMSLTYTLTGRDGSIMRGPRTVTAQTTQKYGGIYEQTRGGPRLRDLPAREKTLRGLVRDLAEIVAEELASSGRKFKVALDRGIGLWGEKDIRKGVNLALAGKWNEAMKIWNQVLNDDPEHSAACYNLGVAYESLGGLVNLEKAVGMYSRAVQEPLGYRPMYREALTRATVTLRELQARQDR